MIMILVVVLVVEVIIELVVAVHGERDVEVDAFGETRSDFVVLTDLGEIVAIQSVFEMLLEYVATVNVVVVTTVDVPHEIELSADELVILGLLL